MQIHLGCFVNNFIKVHRLKIQALLLCLILAGCSSMSVFQSPGVLPKGKTETGIGASFIGDEDKFYFVNLEVHTRQGLELARLELKTP